MSNTSTISPSKRSKTGDGHTMSKIDVQNELAKQENELRQSYKGYECVCRKCGEKYEISPRKHTYEEKLRLTEYLSKGGCVACQSWKTAQYAKTSNALVEHTFKFSGLEIKALKVPHGYRPRKIIKTDEKGKPILI